jgi:type II secretory pathway pseudopilin PulG
MAAVLILGVIAAALIARFSNYLPQEQQNACYLQQGEIEVQAQLYFRNNGAWPPANLSGFGTNTEYFPDGHLPACPTGGTYSFNSATGKVTCTHHP